MEDNLNKDNGSQPTNKPENNSNKKIVVAVLVVVILAVGTFAAYAFVGKKTEEPESSTKMGYEASVLLGDDSDAMQKAIDEAIQKAKEGTMNLVMKMQANSTDGENFVCMIGNAEENNYDMFVTINLADTGEELYTSGLIPVGNRIESFKINKTLSPGTYNTVMTLTQMEDDLETEHAEVGVEFDLVVTD